MNTHVRTIDDLVGTHRTFGEVGPVYCVLSKRDEAEVRVRVIVTGEELNYPAAQALEDPEAP